MKNILKWFSILSLTATAALAAEPLLLQWGTIETDGAAAQAESAALKAKVAKKAALARTRKTAAAAEERAAYVVQFAGPVSEAQRTWLEASTQVRGYIPENAYIVWATASEMETIAAAPDVAWTGEWKKEYKTVRASAAKRTAAASDEARWMQVGSLLAGDDGAADLRARLEALPATVRSAFPRLDGVSAVAYLTDAQVDEVASWADVDWIEPKLKPILLNDKAALTNMMNVTPAWKAISAGGLGLTGAGQVVAVADTGCDKGSTSDIHADFSGRVKAGYGWTNGAYKSSASWADYDAHGTHVCGSVLGSGAQSDGQFRGIAYEAQLVMQGCWEDLGGLPDNAQDLFKQAYSQGARIHSDSWGFGTNLAAQYVYDAVYADGYMWTNQNFLALFAAGNDGIDKNKDGVIDPGSVTPPSTSKNCLSVGAAENYRSSGGYSTTTWGGAWGSDYPTAPIKSDKISGTTTPQGLAAFSSRGPTADGRFKPDIVAPGTDIISVRSRVAQDDGWGVYTSNTNYLYEGGTSMATPLTSGATALVRQWLVDRQGIAEPMAALMKALLVNGARDMTPGQYGTGSTQEITARPDRSQGFGHVNLYNALEPGDGNFLVFATNKFTAAGANFTTNIAVGQANAGKYILTLAWQDYPGTSGASKTLVNDLDLTVTSPSGTVYYPNNYGTLDHTNNVEFIEFTATEVGSYAVKVNAYKISKTTGVGSQPFALVMRGPETVLEPASPEFTSATSATEGVQNGDIEFTFSDILSAGYPAPTYTITTAVSTDEYDFDGDTGYLYFQPADAGTFTFTCVASNEYGAATNTLTVTVTLAQPPAPPEPTVVASDSFTAIWTAVSGATGYELVVVEGAAGGSGTTLVETFANATYSTTGSGYADQTISGGDLGTWTATGCRGDQGAPVVRYGGTLTSPSFEGGVSSVEFDYAWPFSESGNCDIELYVNGASQGTATVTGGTAGTATYTLATPVAGSSTIEFRNNATSSKRIQVTEVRIATAGRSVHTIAIPRAAGDVVFSNSVGNVTSYQVTGLQPDTTYSYSYRAIVDGEATPWSESTAVTTSEGDAAPVWSELPAQNVTVGDDATIDLNDYVAGSPTPAITLDTTTAAAADYEYEDGLLVFIPSTPGTYTFTFTAANTVGSATATLTVTASAAPVTVPTLLVGDETDTTAYATWDACTGVSSYTLQLASDDQFTTGGSGGAVLEADFSDTTGWTLSGTGTYTGSGYYGAGSPSIKFDTTGDYAISPDFGAGTKLSFWGFGNNGDGSTFAISGLVNGSWQDIETVTIAKGGATYEVNLPSGTSQVRFDFTKSVNCALDDVVVTGASGTGSLIAEYTVADTEYTFTGLTPYTVYYARVKGNADWSNVEEFLTEEEVVTDTAPSWKATFPATGTVDVGELYELADIASYASGSPAPTITFTAPDGVLAEINNGNFQFIPEASGDYTFTFTAANGISPDATATHVVTAVGQAPVLTASLGTSVAATVGEDVEFTVTATGIPAPTVAMAATEYDAVFLDGAFAFAPAAVGTYAFTFTAENTEGTDTLTVTVTVSAAPVTVPELLVGDVTDTTAYATWSECTGVASYTLQLASDNQFTTGGSGGSVLDADFSDTTGWTLSGTGTYANSPYYGAGSPSIKFDGTGDYAISPDFGSGTKLSFWAYGNNGDGSTFAISGLVNGSWTDIETVTIAKGGATYEVDLPAGTSQVRFDFTKSVNCALDDVVVTGASGTGSLIAEYTVADTEYTFTGLTPYTVYYARVKGNAGWSGTEEFITEEAPVPGTPPSWSALPTPSVVAGSTYELDLSGYVSGDPAPVITMADTDLDAILIDGEFAFTPVATGTATFTFTASNTAGTATATLTVTVTGSAPVWQTLPARTIAVEEDLELNLTSYVSGTPTPAISLTTGGDIADFDPADDNYFYFTTPTAGTYSFVFTAENVLGTATATLTVTVTGGDTPVSGYEQWIADNNYPEEPGSTIAENGHTYWENYIADIDPTSTNELELVPNPTTGSTFTVPAASSNRYYQLIYSTNLAGGFITNNLGWGATGASDITFPADWYGSIRVLLDEP